MYTRQEVEQFEKFINSLIPPASARGPPDIIKQEVEDGNSLSAQTTEINPAQTHERHVPNGRADEYSAPPPGDQPPPYPPQVPQTYHGTLRSNQNVPPEPRPIPPNCPRQHPYMNRTMRHNIPSAQNRSWPAPFPHEHPWPYRPNMPWTSNPYSLMIQAGSNYANTPGFLPNRWPAGPQDIPAIPSFMPQAYGAHQDNRAMPPINWTNQGSFPELVEPSSWCSPRQCSPESLQQQVWARQLWQAEQEIRQNPNPGVGWRPPPPPSYIPDGALGSDVLPGPQYGIYLDRNARNPPPVHSYQEQARQSMDLQARQGFELWMHHVMAVYGNNVRANSQTMRDQNLDEANFSPEFRRGAFEMAQFLISKASNPNEPWENQGS